MILNTTLNENEPIVSSPEEALELFKNGYGYKVIENFYITKLMDLTVITNNKKKILENLESIIKKLKILSI